ncbi:MAG: DUF6311 domain-containing protein [Lachnospiraceae bacterium]|nr:DUF6311 domain-containing protein [Lachnospiraceae bacterium]
MFDVKTPKRIDARLLFALAAVIGAVCFIGIYGVSVLDFTETGWLVGNYDAIEDYFDLMQHFVGWCHFRNDPWQFPIGLIDSLSYPHSLSVIYTDSIPLFAVAFKLFSPYLPQDFQYFGLFGILSFALMGGFSAILLRRFGLSDIQCALGSVFYVISSTMICRMFFHTSLSAQFLIVAALVMWVYDGLMKSDKMRISCWALMGFLCVGIHSYFLPMTGMILAALAVTQFHKKKIWLPIAEITAFSAAGLINLYVLGGFYGKTDASGMFFGAFGSNLNTFINPWEVGRLLPRLPLQNEFQYEGVAYLGAGILFLFGAVAAGLVIRFIRHVPEEAFHSDRIYGRAAMLLFAMSFLLAVIPVIAYNETTLVRIPFPRFLERILAIFRSNGRLVWPAMYLLMTAAISFAAYTFRHYRYVGTILIAAALVLQICDFGATFEKKNEIFTAAYGTETVWDDEEASAFVKGKREFIFLYTDNDITIPTAYYGYAHRMRQNNYYFARDIDDKINGTIGLYYAELDNKNMRDDAVYVLKAEDYRKYKEYYDGLDAEKLEKFDHVMLKAKKKDHGNP